MPATILILSTQLHFLIHYFSLGSLHFYVMLSLSAQQLIFLSQLINFVKLAVGCLMSAPSMDFDINFENHLPSFKLLEFAVAIVVNRVGFVVGFIDTQTIISQVLFHEH